MGKSYLGKPWLEIVLVIMATQGFRVVAWVRIRDTVILSQMP